MQSFFRINKKIILISVVSVALILCAFILFTRLAVNALYREQPKVFYSSTVYYTPRESGFSAKAGYNMTPQSIAAVPSRTFPADFLKAVRMEGTGRMKNSIDGKKFLAYTGNWQLVDRPLGNRSNFLEPMRSAAIAKNSGKWKRGDWVLIRSKNLPSPFQNSVWRIDDVGGGVGGKQLDLYSGVDDPAGPGESILRPASHKKGRIQEVVVLDLTDRPLLRKALSFLHFFRIPF